MQLISENQFTYADVMPTPQLFSAWFVLMSAAAFVLFGYDKLLAMRCSRRIAESTLLLSSALGGWPGGLLGIIVFRHKSAKPTFLGAFAAAFCVWAALLAGALKFSDAW